jgi:hypothetical protein
MIGRQIMTRMVNLLRLLQHTLHPIAAHPLAVNRERSHIVSHQRDCTVQQRPFQGVQDRGVLQHELDEPTLEQLVSTAEKYSPTSESRLSQPQASFRSLNLNASARESLGPGHGVNRA